MLNLPFIYFLNTHGVFVLFFCVLAYLWFVKKNKEQAIHILLAALITGLVVLIIKELSSIPRPYIAYNVSPLAGYSVRTSSLPSLHTALAFALATTVTLHERKLGIILFVAAAVIGFGRVVAFVHYPLDVILGAVVGSVVALLVENARIPKHRKRGA